MHVKVDFYCPSFGKQFVKSTEERLVQPVRIVFEIVYLLICTSIPSHVRRILLKIVRCHFSQAPGVTLVMSLKKAMNALSLANPSSKALQLMLRPVARSSMARISRHCWRHC